MTDATSTPPALLLHWPAPRPRSWLGALAVVASGLAGLFWFHLADFTSHFKDISGDAGDTRLIAFLLEHQWQALLGHAPWASPPMFYPVPGTLGYADAFVLQGLVYWPLRALGAGVLTALQGSTLLLNALNYAAMAWLLRRVLGLGPLATIAGSLLFAFNSAKFNQFVHLQLQPLVLLPLMVALLIGVGRGAETLRPRGVFLRLAAVALLLDLQLLSGVYVAWFFGFFVLFCLVFALIFAITRAWLLRAARVHARAILAAGGVFVVGAIPFALLYVPVLRQAGWRSYGDARGMIPHWFSLVVMGDGNWLWAWLEDVIPPFRDQPFYWEHRIGLGGAVTVGWLLLAVAVLRAVRRWPVRARDGLGTPNSAHFVAILVLAATAFYALGMSYFGHSPWWFAFHTVPGIKSIRAVSRYPIVLALPIGLALAWTLDALVARASRASRLALVLLVAFGALEQVGTRQGFDKAAETARLQALAVQLPKDCRAFYVTSPVNARSTLVSVHIDAMFVAQLTGVPTLNGYSGQEPPNWRGLFFLRDPAYLGFVAHWVRMHGLRGKLCALADPD